MKVEINGTEWTARWIHEKYETPVLRLFGNRKGHWHEVPVKAGTICKLSIPAKPAGTISFFGFSWCSAKDNFSKQEGRKRSLQRALSRAGFAKEERQKFWAAYDAEIGVVHRQHGLVAV